MSATLVPKSALPDIVELYNREGKDATYAYMRETYGVKSPQAVMRRVNKSYRYDPECRQFFPREASPADDVFMNLDELCGKKIPVDDPPKKAMDLKNDALNNLIHELISDRLLILSKYVTIDVADKKVLIDHTSLKADGYHIMQV